MEPRSAVPMTTAGIFAAILIGLALLSTYVPLFFCSRLFSYAHSCCRYLHALRFAPGRPYGYCGRHIARSFSWIPECRRADCSSLRHWTCPW